MAQVEVVNGNIEKAILAFKKEIARDGILREVRNRARNDFKPSSRKKFKAMIAKKRRERLARRRYRDAQAG
jgi:ribosomal protein S21